MNIFFTGKNVLCPRCTHRTFLRVRRRWWMKLLSTSRFYRCDKCNKEILVLTKTQDVASSDKRKF